jgi:hypothetical protein
MIRHRDSRCSSSSRPRRTRLGLETLEDRLAPAVINVVGDDDVAGSVTQTSPSVFSATSLRAAIGMANTDGNAADTINLTVSSTYVLKLGELAYTGSHDLTFQNTSGGNAKIDGGGRTRVFDLNPAAQNTTPFTVTFQGLNISGGVASPGDADIGSGGGIRAQGAASVVLNGDSLIDNTATADGGGIALESIGNVSVGTLTITNCFIDNNHAGDAGGGVESDGNGLVTINASTIKDNTCVNQGAGVWLDAGTANLNMTGDVVTGNVAQFMLAGGIGNAGTGSVTLVGCTVENNSAGSSLQTVNGTPTLVPGTGGGFADAVNQGNLTVINCLFLDNSAAGNGAGIQEGGPTTIITGTVFDGNVSGGNGGALFVNGGSVIVKNSLFRHNVAVNGGAVEADCNVFTATNVTFDTNHAMGLNGGNENNAGGGGNGGGAEIQMGGTAAPNDLFANCLFVGNTANNGTQSNGGAICDVAGALEVSNCQLTGNVAGGSGGAIADSSTGNLLVFASTFNNNTALASSGGAISEIATATVEESTLVGNSAGTNGGGIFESAGSLTLLADTINANSTGNIGGGVSVFNGSLTIGNTIVFGNTTAFGAPDVFGTITDKGGNLIGVAPPAFGAGTLVGKNPMLGLLESNGGPVAGGLSLQQVVQTEALLPGSPAIGTGVTGVNPFNLDARFFLSPSQGRTNPSIGAYEPQYAGNASGNQAFVENLYEVLLGRPADPGMVGFVKQLDSGVSGTVVAQEIVASPEYRTNQVQLLYQRYLNRAADAGGLQGFMNFLGNGGTLEQVASLLVGSQEYFDQHGDSDETFLTGLYESALGRSPDVPGLVGFEQALQGGLSRTQAALAIFSSAEYDSDLVRSDYSSLLGRNADGGGLAFFVSELQHGGTDQLVLAQILGSGESFGNRA